MPINYDKNMARVWLEPKSEWRKDQPIKMFGIDHWPNSWYLIRSQDDNIEGGVDLDPGFANDTHVAYPIIIILRMTWKRDRERLLIFGNFYKARIQNILYNYGWPYYLKVSFKSKPLIQIQQW